MTATDTDTRHDLTSVGIRDENLPDAIVDVLVDEGSVHWQDGPHIYVTGLDPDAGITPDELDRIVKVAIVETARRIAEDIEGQRDDLDVIGHAASPMHGAYTSAAGIARTLAALHGAEAGR